MSNVKMLQSVISEYGVKWLFDRTLYGVKLKSLSALPVTENIYEKKTTYPSRTDIFTIDVNALKNFIREKLSDDDKEKLIETADKACDGIITGFLSIELNYGNPINWQLNPLTKKQCDVNLKWYEIPDFDEERGDIKIIWEASRFSHFITFARAYLLTDDEKYYKAFSEQLSAWLDNNPYSYGANYKCSQECSLRMVNALLSYTVFKERGVAGDRDASNIKDLIDRCYRKVLSNFFYAYKCIKNNHTISELMGMLVGAWCCRDDKQLDTAYELLDEVTDEQFTDDGGYCQFSFNYQRLALQDLEVILSIENVTKRQLNNNSKNKIKRAAELMYQCQDETGDMPNYGSNDGALVFPVTSCGYRDFRPVINTAYALVTGRQLYDEGIHQEELLWFSGEDKTDSYELININRTSSRFLATGLFTYRNQDSWAMIVANDYHIRPAHMDQLHFDLWVSGVNVFCDVGTYSYASETGRTFARNESHNTANVKSIPQMNVYGTFMVYDRTKRKINVADKKKFDACIAAATGYKHRRMVQSAKSRYVITDVVDKDAYILFHTPCDVEMHEKEVVIKDKGHILCILKYDTKAHLEESKRSLFYLRTEPISTIAIRAYANKKVKTVIEIGEKCK